MFCPHCGASAQDAQAYCRGCGAALSATRTWPTADRPAQLPWLAGQPGMRILAYGAAGVLGMLLISFLLKALLTLAVPLLLIAVVVYWARERARGYF